MTISGLSIVCGYSTHCTKYKNFYKWSLNFGLPGVSGRSRSNVPGSEQNVNSLNAEAIHGIDLYKTIY